jgi:molybdate transport system substrate-binding protein
MPREPSSESPSDSDLAWIKDWKLGVNICVERHGKLVLATGQMQLLEAIDRCHSISAAAREIGVSYRHAWLLVEGVNEGAGEPLVEKAVGGTRGGGARLTPHGKQAVEVFREVRRQVQAHSAGVVPRIQQTWETLPSLHVAAAISLQEVLGQLFADYAVAEPDVRVRVVFGASNELAEHLLSGAPGHLFITADAGQIERLRAAGRLADSPTRVLAQNRLVAIAAVGRPLPIDKPADLLSPEIGRIALAELASPLGQWTRTYLEKLGLREPVEARALFVDNSRAVIAAIHGGRADVGLAYGSDAVAGRGCQILFQTRRSQAAPTYTAALLALESQSARAEGLLQFLSSPAAAARFKACGFLPAD